FLINENINSQNNSNLLGNISFQNDMISFLNQNFHKKITLNEISTIFQIDKFKLLRIFKSLVGLSPQEYLTSLRIENSKKMILENESIVNTALDSGFYDQSHFTNSFKKFVGVSPNEYRKSCNIFQDSSSLIG
ncbi:MAG: AraC family transcriptional regulator, partial [Candidatus Kapabacteria bacterium]|nr:AraC family transcriptional regulator [Candidatus Kapabacteria bacterium]